VEQFYPFPEPQIVRLIAAQAAVGECFWVQEEPENMGGWNYIRPRMEPILGKPLRFVGRPAAASPATGFTQVHREQQAAILADALGE